MTVIVKIINSGLFYSQIFATDKRLEDSLQISMAMTLLCVISVAF